METASFEGFIKTIFYIIVISYILRLLIKIFLPILLRKAVQKAGQSFQQQARQYQNQPPRRSSDVVIDTSGAAKSREKKKVGEYVDYEELN